MNWACRRGEWWEGKTPVLFSSAVPLTAAQLEGRRKWCAVLSGRKQETLGSSELTALTAASLLSLLFRLRSPGGAASFLKKSCNKQSNAEKVVFLSTFKYSRRRVLCSRRNTLTQAEEPSGGLSKGAGHHPGSHLQSPGSQRHLQGEAGTPHQHPDVFQA